MLPCTTTTATKYNMGSQLMGTDIISCYATRKLFNYAIGQGVSIADLLTDPDIVSVVRYNAENWITQDKFIVFVRKLSEKLDLGIFSLSYKANLNTKFDNIQLGIFRTVPLSVMAKFSSKFFRDTINKNLSLNISKLNKVRKELLFDIRVENKLLYHKDICEYNKGAAVGIMEQKGYHGVHLEELTCACDDPKNNICRYRIVWNSKEKIPYYKVVTDFVKLFLKKKDRIPQYVWDAMPKHVGVPVSADDLKILFSEDD